MTRTTLAYPANCDPTQVLGELDRLMVEFAAHPLPGRGWPGLAAYARWSSHWQGEQWSRLGVWARATDQPEAVRRAVLSAEHYCATEALNAEARAMGHERKAAKAAQRDRAGA